MRADPARPFDAGDAENTRDFLLDVLAIPFFRATDGSRILAYPPGDIGVHPRALAAADRGAFGPRGLALTCDNPAETTSELSAAGCTAHLRRLDRPPAPDSHLPNDARAKR